MRLNYPELVHKHPAHLAYPVKMYFREGSVQSNHPELVLKNSTHLVIPAVMWFEKVQEGSMHLKYPELVHITLLLL